MTLDSYHLVLLRKREDSTSQHSVTHTHTPIDVDIMPTPSNGDNLEEEDLDGTVQALLSKREEIFDKVENIILNATETIVIVS